MGKPLIKGPSDALWMQCRDFPLEFTIPGHPPSINSLYATFRGRRIKSREGHKWEGFSLIFVRRAALEAYGTFRLEDLKGRPLRMEIAFYRPTWKAKNGNIKRWDVDGHLKCLIDSSLTALNLDDSAILELRASKIEDAGPERTYCKLIFLEDK